MKKHVTPMSVSERYARFLVRHAWAVVIAVMAVTAGLVAGFGRLHAEFKIEASLPANHPFVRIDHEIRRDFGGRNTMIVAIVPRYGDVWRPEVLEVVQDVTFAALRLPDVITPNVVSLAAPSVRHAEEVDGAITVDYLMHDVPRTPEAIAQLRARVDDDPQLRGLLVTPDNRAALVFLDFWEDAAQEAIFAATTSLAEPYRDRPLDFYFAGEPVAAVNAREQSQEVAWCIPLTFLVIAGMLVLSFRSLQGMLLPMLTAILSVVWAFGFMGYSGIVIDSWNVAVPILLIAVAAAHSAQMLKRYGEEVVRLRDNRAAVIASTATMGPVMIAAGATAALGFASLAVFGVPSIANFGLSCAYGIGSAVVLEMTFIPALRSLLPAPPRVPGEGGPTARLLSALAAAILQARGRRVLIGTSVALVVAVLGAFFIRTYGSTREYLPRDSLARRHLEEIEKHFPGTVTFTILYEGEPGSARTVALLQHQAALQAELEADPLVLRTASLADLVKALHKTFNSEDPHPYRVPDDQPLVAQLMYLGESPAFERFTDRALSKALVLAYLRDDDSARVGPLVRRAQAWVAAHPAPPGVQVLIAGGVGPTVLAVNEHTTHGKLLNTLVVLVVIYVVSSIVLRSPLGGLFVVSPIALTVLMLFGLLGWTGIRLEMGSASVIAMAAGIGADYAIYFLYRLREERARLASDEAAVDAALHTSGRAVLFVASSIGAGFAVMAFSHYPGLRLFGILMPIAMVTSCLAALSIMPVLVLRSRPAFVFGPTRTAVPAATQERTTSRAVGLKSIVLPLLASLVAAEPPARAFDVVLNAQGEFLDAYLVNGSATPSRVVFNDPDPADPGSLSDVPRGGRHLNGKLCFFPKRGGHRGQYLLADDAYREACLDVTTPQARCAVTRRKSSYFLGRDPDGWAVFNRKGMWTRLHIDVPWDYPNSPQPQGTIDPQGCLFDAKGRLFGNDVGHGAARAPDGSLLVFFPGRDNRYSTYCFIDKGLSAPGMPVMDDAGNVYVAEPAAFRVTKFSPPFPTSPRDCDNPDHLVTTPPIKTTFFPVPGQDTGGLSVPVSMVRVPKTDHWYIDGAILPPIINEYDRDGAFVRNIVPANVPKNPIGMDVGSDGTLYYAELNLDPVTLDTRCGSMVMVKFDANAQPQFPQVIGRTLRFPDGVTVVDSKQFAVDFTKLVPAVDLDPSACGGE